MTGIIFQTIKILDPNPFLEQDVRTLILTGIRISKSMDIIDLFEDPPLVLNHIFVHFLNSA